MVDQIGQNIENGIPKVEQTPIVKSTEQTEEAAPPGAQEQKIIERIDKDGDEDKVLSDIATGEGSKVTPREEEDLGMKVESGIPASVGEPEKPLTPEEQESAERGERIDEIVNYFNSPAAAESRQQLLQEQDPEKRRLMLDQMADRINTLSTGEQQPKFLETTKVKTEGIDQEWGVEWQPPRPANDIYEAYTAKAADLIAAGDTEGAAAIMFQAVNLVHPYLDGNGRTSRLLYLYMQNPEAVKNPTVVDAFLRKDYRRGKSREASSQNLTSALKSLKQKYGVDRLPLLRFEDGSIGNMGLGNELRSMAYVTLGGEARQADDLPVVVDYANLPPEEAASLEERTNALRREVLQSLLDLPEERQVVKDKISI